MKKRSLIVSFTLALVMIVAFGDGIPVGSGKGLIDLFGIDRDRSAVYAHECEHDGGGGDQGDREECNRGKSGGGGGGGGACYGVWWGRCTSISRLSSAVG